MRSLSKRKPLPSKHTGLGEALGEELDISVEPSEPTKADEADDEFSVSIDDEIVSPDLGASADASEGIDIDIPSIEDIAILDEHENEAASVIEEIPAPPEPDPAPMSAPLPPHGASPLAAELEEVDEYIALGLYEDAQDTLGELLKQHPDDEDVLAKIGELGFSVEQVQKGLAEETAKAPTFVAPVAPEPVQDESLQQAEFVPSAPAVDDFDGDLDPLAAALPDALLTDEEIGIEALVDTPSPQPARAASSSTGGQFIDLASELSDEIFGTQSVIDEDEDEPEGPLTDPGLDQIFKEFRKGVEKQLGAEDYDTRYNLGIAYKEMGLLDEAIAEFQLAKKDELRGLECCSMLGLCFMEKGMPDIAIKWFSKGLALPGRREEEYHGLRYDLAQAHEAANESERALELYKEIFNENARFRDVKDRVSALQATRK